MTDNDAWQQMTPESLVETLKNSDRAVCVAAVRAIAQGSAENAADVLLAILRAESRHVITYYGRGQGTCLSYEPRSHLHDAVVKALSHLGVNAMASLKAGLNDASWSVRESVAKALGHFRHPEVEETLKQALGDPYFVRTKEFLDWGMPGETEMVDFERYPVREAAEEALRQVRSRVLTRQPNASPALCAVCNGRGNVTRSSRGRFFAFFLGAKTQECPECGGTGAK